MRSHHTITASLVALILSGGSSAQDAPITGAHEQDITPVFSTNVERVDTEYLKNTANDAQDMIDGFCQYLEETGVDDSMDIIQEHIRLGSPTEALQLSMQGFDVDTLEVRIRQEGDQTLCRYDIYIGSTLCGFSVSQTIMNDVVWLIDDHQFRRVIFTSQTEFLDTSGLSDNKYLPPNVYAALNQLPKTSDRLFLAAAIEESAAYSVSILELPSIKGCYEITAMNVNDDGLMDLAVYDPSVYVISEGIRKQPSRVYCADETGHFSNRFCGGKQRELPPHLRIKRRY